MRQVKPFVGAHRNRMASAVAGAPWGAIDVLQLADCGVSADAVSRWRAGGKLFLIHPAVYAYGHPWLPIEGRMVAAILHAGEGTVLSHATAARWWGLIDRAPAVIDVSTPTRARSTDGVRVHHPPAQMERDRRRELHARRAGLTLIRYTWSQVAYEADLVEADLSSAVRSAGSGSR
jgi:hypothetical protein